MKKFLLLFFALFALTYIAKAQLPVLSENFDSGMPAGWTQIDADGDGLGWEHSSNPASYFASGTDLSGTGHNGSTGFALSGSYSNNTGVLFPDNWLITSAINLTGPGNLSFWICAQDASYSAEHYGVYISTTTNTDTSAFILLYEATIGQNRTQTAWENHIVNLSAYEGETVYIAFRHFNCSDEFVFNLDDVEVTVMSSDPLIIANPSSVNLTSIIGSSSATSITVDGYNLSSAITATTSTPFEVSEDGVTYGYTASLAQAGGTLYVQYSPYATGTESGTITLSSAGATDVTINVTGTALEAAELPYSQNFEDTIENLQWIIENNNSVNGWYFGTATNATPNGERSLYVSNNNGTSNEYTNTSVSSAWAYRDFDFGNHSEYNLSFKYKCYGESSYDNLKVYLGAPADVPVAATYQIGATYYSGVSSWTEVNISIPSTHTGAQRLYFLWTNDYSDGTNPPAAIDDIVITASDCGSTSVPTVSNITAFTADVAWQPAVEEDNTFFVQYVPAGSSWDDADAVFLNVTGTTVQLTNLEPNTTYQLRVATDCSGDTSIWKTTSFTTKATCYPPVHVTASQVVGTSAMISWEEATYGANDYTVAYTETGEDNWISEVVDGTFFMLSNLEPTTSYDVMVFSNCDLGTADTIELNFTTNCLVGGDLLIGEGTNTSSYLPEYCLYNYSYTQQIYLASEVGSAADISFIAFNASSIESSATSANRHLKIYLMHTTAATNDWLPATSAQLVYDDTPTLTTGWNTFHFTTPFQYDGISNLAVIVVDETGSWSSSNSFLCHTTEQSLSHYIYQDSAPYSTSSVPSGGSTTSYRNNVIFGIPCDSNATCVSPNVYIADVSEESITVDWAPGYDETSWELEYTSDTDWTNVGSVTAPYELTGLDANTTYLIRVRSICGSSEYSEWAGTSARTQCDAITNLPFTENFDTYSTGTGTYPLCWYKKNTYSSDRPYISTTHYNGQGSLYFYTNENGTYNMAITPEFDASIDITTLQATFMYRAMYQGNRLLVGVMTDPNDASTFTIVDTVFPDATVSNWVEKEVYFDQYTEGGQYIAFKNESDGSNAYSYIDNLVIDIANTCRKPSNLLISSVSSNEATLSWTANGDESSWNIAYGPVGINPTDEDDEDVTIVPAGTNPFTLTGLDALTAYDVFVQADCGGGATSNWILTPVRLETAGCDTTEQCEYTFVAIDSYGDGWNDAYIEIVQNGVSVATVTAESHGGGSVQSTDTIRLLLCGDYPTQLIWHSGSYDDEASFTLIGSDGVVIVSANDMSAYSTDDVIANFTTNCSGCTAPGNLAYTLSSDGSSATITWTAGSDESDWILEYQAGNEEWVTENISGTPSYTLNSLTEATLYTVHVKADCGYGISGFQTITFNTPICDSVDMCQYTLNLTDNASDGWNGASLIVMQNGIVVASNITIPSGESNTVNLSLCSNMPTQLIWHSGSWDNECCYTLLGPDGTTIATHSGMSAYTTNTVVDTFTTNCDGCFMPSNMNVTLSSDGSSATITWTAGNEETAWILQYQAIGETTWTTENITTTPEYTINNLASSTSYNVRIKSDCGGGEESNFQTISFITPCDIVSTLPYSENFDNISSGSESAFPICWARPIQYSGYPYAVTAYQHSAPASLRFQSLTTVPTTAVTPQFAEDAHNLSLNFWLKAESITYSGTFEVGVMTDPNDTATFVGVWTIQPTSTDWTEYTINFDTTAVSGANKYIAFRQHSNSSSWYYWLDDVTIDLNGTPTPPTDPTVTTNAASGIGQTSATLTASITNPSGVTITAKGFEWKQTIGGSYTTIAGTGTGTGNDFTANLTGLTANTNYTFRAFITFNGTTVTGDETTFTTLDEGQQTCNVPTNLTATATAYNTANVTWTAGGSETSWNLQYRTGTANWTTLPVNATTYQITGLAAQTTYEVRVQANCGDNNTSDWTATVSFTTPDAPVDPCDAPTNLQVNSITQTSATMTWTAGGSETSWKVGYKLSTASQWQEATVQTTSYDIEGLTANSTYDVRVKAVCAADNESDFITSSFTTTGVGIDNITLANSINLMPNPADNYIELSINSNVEVKEAVVFNAFGQMIQTVQLTENHARIDLSNMAAGMYFVRVNGEGVSAVKKFIRK